MKFHGEIVRSAICECRAGGLTHHFRDEPRRITWRAKFSLMLALAGVVWLLWLAVRYAQVMGVFQ